MSDTQKQFVHLHVHSEYSLLDGAVKIDALLNKCKALGMPAVALTDHGNMYAAWRFFHAAKKAGVKPILGCEFYTTENLYERGFERDSERGEMCHLVLLAKNLTGYRNLCKLNSVAFAEGFYRRPRIDFKLLKEHSEGLVCLSACIAGEVPRLLLQNRLEQAKQAALRYKNLFGDDYYIEIQDHGIDEQKMTNPMLINLARELDIKLVVTNDVHYLDKSDAEAQDILLCVQTGRFFDEPDRMRFFGEEFYLKSYDEMALLFPNLPEVLSNTLEIAEKCNVELQSEDLMPLYRFDDEKDGESDEKRKIEFFRQLIEEGLKKRYPTETEEIRQRIEYEAETIISMGFVDYYLIVWDFINYAKTNGIPVGPGRGSGAGSVIAYCLGITDVEPFTYHLLFERFLNPHRKTNPDFDIDFCMDRRGEVIDYVYKKYGEGKVSQIVTFGTMAAKNAIRDVARVMRLPIAESNRLAKLVPDAYKFTLNHLLGKTPYKDPKDEFVVEELQTAAELDETKKIINIAAKLDGTPRQTGIHAAGVVICRFPLSEHVPMQTNGGALENGGIFTTQYNMTEVEQVGLLKMDFLGLRTLTDIKKACDYVFLNTGKKIDFHNDSYSDPEVFKTIGSGDTVGIFQLESGGMTSLMKRMQPDGIEDIIAGISLYRPGPMQFIDKYLEGKKSPEKITYSHPMMEPILKVTYGCIVYQEQVMQIVRSLAGFSTALADNVRYAMSKKKTDMMKRLGTLFVKGGVDKETKEVVKGCVENGIDKKTAESIYHELDAFSQYAFNKAHAAGYALLCYQTAYLKTYHPIELLCAILNNRLSNIDEIKKYMNYANSHGIAILPPDINKSGVEFQTENGGLRFGLAAIKKVGPAVIEGIVSERKKGDFVSMSDLFERCSNYLKKDVIENLIKGGAFDCFGRTRADMMQWYQEEWKSVESSAKMRESGQFSLFEMVPELKTQEINHPMAKEFSNAVKINFEKEVLGFYLSGSPLDDYDKVKQKFNFTFDTSMLQQSETELDDCDDSEVQFIMEQTMSLKNKIVVTGGILREVKTVKGKEGRLMGFGVLEDKEGMVEVAMFFPYFEKSKALWSADKFVVVTGVVAEGRDGMKINIRQIVDPNAEAPQIDDQSEAKSDTSENEQTTLCLNMERRDDEVFSELLKILSQYEGELGVKLKMGQKRFALDNKVRNCPGIVYELEKLLGAENVVFYKKTK